MAVVRGNLLSSTHSETFLDGVLALSQRLTSITPTQLNGSSTVQAAPAARVFGAAAELERPLSWWDLFAWWHFAAMSWPAGVGNRAHRGSVFLPWHRLYLRRLEEAIQLVTDDADFALPYWDWSQDGMLAPGDQLTSPVWSIIGEPRGTVAQGKVGQLRVRLLNNSADGRLYIGPPRPIWRDAGRGVTTLPTRDDENAALGDHLYDGTPWNERADSFRNKLEGFQDPREAEQRSGPWMHNRVHVWVGGEMAPGTSPNDPVFWLNHCNVDRIWEGWMTRGRRTYLPAAGQGPVGQRADDPLFSIVWPSLRAEQVLDPTELGLDWYRYDALPA
jgi:tyrosinase